MEFGSGYDSTVPAWLLKPSAEASSQEDQGKFSKPGSEMPVFPEVRRDCALRQPCESRVYVRIQSSKVS